MYRSIEDIPCDDDNGLSRGLGYEDLSLELELELEYSLAPEGMVVEVVGVTGDRRRGGDGGSPGGAIGRFGKRKRCIQTSTGALED